MNSIVVTNELAGQLLQEKHGLPENQFHTITQGMPQELLARPSALCQEIMECHRDSFSILYTGNFYAGFSVFYHL